MFLHVNFVYLIPKRTTAKLYGFPGSGGSNTKTRFSKLAKNLNVKPSEKNLNV